MASLTKFAGTVSQTTGGSYRTFSDLNNIRNSVANSWANSNGNIKGKNSSPNRPSSISCTNFSFNLPTGAEVSKVTVEYRHRKNGKLSIGSPTITLLGVSGKSGKGVAPTSSMVTSSKSFTGLTRTQVNSSSFGVEINYPANTSTNEGTLSISFVRITVEYKVPSYSLTLKKVSGGYNEESYTVEASISNTNLTSYNPGCTLTAPTGFSFKSFGGSGEYTVVSPTTVSWNPKLTSKTASATAHFEFDVNVTYPSGSSSYTGNLVLSESLYSNSKSLSATITNRPSGEGSQTDPTENNAVIDDDSSFKYLKVIVDEEVPVSLPSINNSVVFGFPVDGDNEIIYLQQDSPIQYNDGTIEDDDLVWTWVTEYSNEDYTTTPVEGSATYEKFRFRTPGHYALIIYTARYTSQLLGAPKDGDYSSYEEDAPLTIIYFDVCPTESSLTTPNYVMLEVTGEELDRLGDGYTYVAQSHMKHSATDTVERDWYKNNRIGIFNNNIENVSDYTGLTDTQIYDNAVYWSEETAGLNDYNSVECEFTYDEDYPLYLIITGDYPEATTYGYDKGTLKYAEPCIIEKAVYNSSEPNGTYPVPINALLDGEDIATLDLVPDQTSQSVILYDFPVDETISTNDKLAIRGLQVRANIEATDNLVVQAKLHSPNGDIGNRSILVDSTDEEIIIGGLGDLWGFTTLQMQHLELWQLELSFADILGNSDATILFNNIEIIFYLETVEKQEITIKVEDEDIAYYGAFIETVKIPEGLHTDTSFLSIDGTDTNDAYRQNIREKTITIEFNLSNCELQTSTDMLRQLTKLFVNEKDQYNRPIPKRIQFSHYPNDYFEYIMEEPFDVDTEITDYNIKASLTIPSGTSYSLEDTVTNTTGNANGLAAVNPTIRFRPSGTNIQITENNTGQTFNIAYTGDWNDHTVELDCEDRKVYLVQDEDTRLDISKYADYNSDWFRLDGEYDFSSVNCTILSVIFNERW